MSDDRYWQSVAIGLLLIAFVLLIIEGALYHNELFDQELYNNAFGRDSLPEWWDLPGWAGILIDVFVFIGVLVFNLFTVNVPDMPPIIRLMIMTPIWLGIGFTLFNFIKSIVSKIPLIGTG